jgi:NAD(P)H-dependent FMN reductase|tara:strand:+ start:3961 stop:4539 length:579 start_codon:yes stop_codon:yes gene_type:complete
MNITGVSFSHSENSMSYRGLLLMNHFINFNNLIKIDLPICDSNKPNGVIPKKVEELDNKLKESDALVFSIPEYTGHYSVGFKNLMDWLVVKAYYNADLGQKYSISNKPVYVITFTPAKKGTGDRHFDMTKDLLEKLGCRVNKMYVKNDCWDNLVPNNYDFVKKECKEILRKDMEDEVNGWQLKYEEWDNKWK